jgi:hypothetical protein
MNELEMRFTSLPHVYMASDTTFLARLLNNAELKYGKVVLLAHPFSCVVLSLSTLGRELKRNFHFSC